MKALIVLLVTVSMTSCAVVILELYRSVPLVVVGR